MNLIGSRLPALTEECKRNIELTTCTGLRLGYSFQDTFERHNQNKTRTRIRVLFSEYVHSDRVSGNEILLHEAEANQRKSGDLVQACRMCGQTGNKHAANAK